MTGKEDRAGQELTVEERGNLANNPSRSLLLSRQKRIRVGGSPRPPPWHGHLAAQTLCHRKGYPRRKTLKAKLVTVSPRAWWECWGETGQDALARCFPPGCEAICFQRREGNSTLFSTEKGTAHKLRRGQRVKLGRISHINWVVSSFLCFCVYLSRRMKAPRFKGTWKKPFWGKYKGGLHEPPKLLLFLMMMNFKKLTHLFTHSTTIHRMFWCIQLSPGMQIQKWIRYSPRPEGLQPQQHVNHVSKEQTRTSGSRHPKLYLSAPRGGVFPGMHQGEQG